MAIPGSREVRSRNGDSRFRLVNVRRPPPACPNQSEVKIPLARNRRQVPEFLDARRPLC